MRPIEVIKEENGGPFAQRTVFGWCIVGPLSNGKSTVNSLRCNRIAVTDTTKNQYSQHYFAIQDEVKDVDAATALMDMYRKEFNEPTPKEMKKQLLKHSKKCQNFPIVLWWKFKGNGQISMEN